MDLKAWLHFVQTLAQAYALSQGKDIRALGYLNFATSLVRGKAITERDLARLQAEYWQKVADQTPTTAEELAELDRRLGERSAALQGS